MQAPGVNIRKYLFFPKQLPLASSLNFVLFQAQDPRLVFKTSCKNITRVRALSQHEANLKKALISFAIRYPNLKIILRCSLKVL